TLISRPQECSHGCSQFSRENTVHTRRTPGSAASLDAKSPAQQGFFDAPERTRTSTDHTVHKALNLARLPIPPQAQRGASIAAGRTAEDAREARLASVPAERYSANTRSFQSTL